MTEEKKLYPLKFYPIAETFSWGGKRIRTKFAKSFVINDENGDEHKLDPSSPIAESLELADLGYRDSVVKEGWLAGNTIGEIMDMYVDRIVGENIFDFFGRQFPLCIKIIDAHSRMPLRVHPDNSTAEERYDHLGKEKFWYVLEAEQDAKILLGFKKDSDPTSFYNACQNAEADKMLNIIRAKKGDCIHIVPGTVHAAEGVILLEIAQSSPLDFCLCRWGKECSDEEFDSSLNLVEAMDFIDWKAYKKPVEDLAEPASADITPLSRCREFTVNRIDLRNSVRVLSGVSDSFIIYCCIDGEMSIHLKAEDDAKSENYILKAGETVLIPSEVDDFMLVPRKSGTAIIESFIEHLEENDSYTGEILQRDEPLFP